jgi:hypothetical protein
MHGQQNIKVYINITKAGKFIHITQLLCYVPAHLNLKNSAFCPQTLVINLIWLSEKNIDNFPLLHQPFFSARCELNQHAVLLL